VQQLGESTNSAKAWRAAAELRAAADASRRAGTFDSAFEQLDRQTRSRIRIQSARLRLWRGASLLLLVETPAILFACVSAVAFKWLPGAFNYALSQATASIVMGIFHGLTAAVIWGGSITCALVLYFIVFGRESAPRSYVRPVGAILTGVLSGLMSSAIVLLLIVTVYTNKSLSLMGWTAGNYEKFTFGLWRELFSVNRFAWPYLLMGTFLGLGMAVMINGLRASDSWNRFLQEQCALTAPAQVWQVIKRLVKLGLRYAWPVYVLVAMGSIVAFAVLRGAPAAKPAHPLPWTGGLSQKEEELTGWKLSPSGEALGIAGDGLTQAIGGSFAIIGMGLGIIVARYGIRIEPQKHW